MPDFESDFTRNKVKQALLPMGYATEGLLDEIDRIYLAAHTSFLASRDEYAGPMGVSQWKNHGDKYGYTKYWERKILASEREKIRKWAAQHRDDNAMVDGGTAPMVDYDDLLTYLSSLDKGE